MRRNGRPRIVVTARRLPAGADAAALERAAVSVRYYLDAVAQGGGDPVLRRSGDPPAGDYDGLLLTGGPDLHPRHYGEEVDESIRTTLTIDEARDAMELALLQEALAADRPVLCICRGIQVLNAAAGGTLWQDLSLAGVEPTAHEQDGRLASWDLAHPVWVEPDSHLAALVGAGTVGVNTFHHQAVARPAPGFHITARASDGTVEGLESGRHRFVLGVQWHPERLVGHHPVHQRLFDRLVEVSR